jgi:hypothetical protein
MTERYARGRLNGVRAEIGTLLGPNAYRELLVVTGQDENGVSVGLAQMGDIRAACEAPTPRSLTEVQVRRKAGVG